MLKYRIRPFIAYELILEFIVWTCAVNPTEADVITRCTEVFNARKHTDVFYDACQPITNFPCTEEASLFADPAGCETFYQCVHTNVLRCPCALGTGYDIGSKTCIANFHANCSCPKTTTMKTTTTELTTQSVTSIAESTTRAYTETQGTDNPLSTKKRSTLAATIGTVAGTAVFLFIIIIIIALVVKHKHAQARKGKRYGDHKNNDMPSTEYDSRISVTQDIYSTIDEDTVTVIRESMYDNNIKALSNHGPLPPLPSGLPDDIPDS